MIWDVIVIGGGLAGSVISNRLAGYRPELKILVVEAGPNANDRQDIVWPNSTNTIGGDFDWKLASVPQVHVDNRSITLAQGKALGGGTVINMGLWTRGDKVDYDLWGEAVADDRWTYDGLLPYMKKAETFWNSTINPDQHGYDGPVGIQSVTSTKRPFPLREKVLQSWHEIGVEPIPLFDGNAGNPLGVAEYTENKSNGRREIAAAAYSLENVTVLTDTQVAKVLLSNTTEGLIATDFIVCSTVPKEGLAKAIEEDEGAAPGPDHPLSKQERTFFEHFFLYSGSTDGSKVAISGIFILPTSRGSIKLASGNITDSPLIDPNYLATAVDRYIVREGIRQEIAFAGGDATVLGREILSGEAVPAGFDEPYTVNSTDEYIDVRIRAAAR
ncbi:hypothetical protein COL922a_008821 [Colletotrichum nupharicola]|nr:hypothetical protein COL922a_008821 [Colletotrichum nupharicola]